MFKKIILVILVLIVALLLFAATKPDTFSLERSTTIQAPPETVFSFVNDFRQWEKWSPWEKLDTTLQRTYGGEATGTGATYAWEGKKIGAGNMTITESTPSSRIAIDLQFTKPFESNSKTDFSFRPEGTGTNVTWTMSGENMYIWKLVSIFKSTDEMVGGDFEKGLADLKRVSEEAAAQAALTPPLDTNVAVQ